MAEAVGAGPVGQGLDRAAVRERVAAGQVNQAPDGTSRSFARILAANLFTLFNAVVAACFLLLLVLGRWQDAVFGLFLVANVLIGVTQEFRAKRTLDRLAVLHTPLARVLREGETIDIAVREVVVDDVLMLHPGDQVPADAVVLESTALEIDEALLTGEAEPIAAEPGRELLSGSGVVGGTGSARVVRVGAESYAHRLTAEARRFSLVASELRGSIARVIRWMSLAIVPVLAIVANGQMQAYGGWAVAIESGQWREAAVASTASIIGMIPQGLVFMTSVAFAVGAVRLSRQRVLVQELAAVEGLARVDTICFDKTGTLTDGDFEFADAIDLEPDAPADWRAVLGWFGGDDHANSTARSLAASFPPSPLPAAAWTVPFSSTRKWSAVAFGVEAASGSGTVSGAWVLGAPEFVLDAQHGAHGEEHRAALDTAAGLAEQGLRTMVLAWAVAGAAPDSVGDDAALPEALRPRAIITLRERIRPVAHSTLSYFASQGVSVRVLSGDSPSTAAAVARAAGLVFEGSGFDARELPDDLDEIAEVLERNQVLGRVSPQQKVTIIRALQSRGRVVAMTGDGVNDALALKHADLGIAMGSGAAVTRAVARVVLLDDDFAHLPRVVDEGRRVLANVERLAKIFLAKTVYATLLAVAFGILLWQFPFLPRHLSAVDGVTIGLPALVLALVPNVRRYEPGFLRRAAAFCIPAGASVAASVVVFTAIVRATPGTDPAAVASAATLTLTIAAFWVLVVHLRPFTLVRALLPLGMLGLLAATYTLPIVSDFFVLTVPTGTLGLTAVGCGVAGAVGVEIVSRISRRSDPQVAADREARRDGREQHARAHHDRNHEQGVTQPDQ